MDNIILKDIVKQQPKSKMNVGDASNTGEYPFFNCSQESKYTHSNYMLDGEYIIVSTGGTPSIKYYSGKFSYSADVLVLSADNVIYVYYFLISQMEAISKMFKGSSLKHLNKKEFMKLKLPNIKTDQKSIAEVQKEIVEDLKQADQEFNRSTKIIESIEGILSYTQKNKFDYLLKE